ncbi:unnamed protein product [Miscanthus lutarioriparius]|uniref:Uncharacterized protein n=1 Tax=Miscanthus lutarioriparius TaxID=422564 RepID=A0A811QW20_9POAL|nr:unnamed protein product [Miscanthus lutarioriparius]
MRSEGVESTTAKSSSGSEGGSKGNLPPANSSAPIQAEAVALSKKTQGKNKKKVRMTQEQIDSYLSYKKPEPMLPVVCPRAVFDAFPQEMLDRLSKETLARCLAIDPNSTNRIIVKSNAEDNYDAMEAEDVRRQYEEKGYVEYEVTDDDKEEDTPVAPRATAPSQVYPAAGRR